VPPSPPHRSVWGRGGAQKKFFSPSFFWGGGGGGGDISNSGYLLKDQTVVIFGTKLHIRSVLGQRATEVCG